MIDTVAIRKKHRRNAIKERNCVLCEFLYPCDSIKLCDALDAERAEAAARVERLRACEQTLVLIHYEWAEKLDKADAEAMARWAMDCFGDKLPDHYTSERDWWREQALTMRALLQRLEWAGDLGGWASCLECFGYRTGPPGEKIGHADGCALNAVLRGGPERNETRVDGPERADREGHGV